MVVKFIQRPLGKMVCNDQKLILSELWADCVHTRAPYLLDCPLKASHNAVLDLVKVLDSFGYIHQQIWASSIGSKAPDLSGLGDIPLILFSKVTGTGLQILTRANITLFNVFGQAFLTGAGLHEQTVVLVG